MSCAFDLRGLLTRQQGRSGGRELRRWSGCLLTGWLSGSQKQTLAESFTAFVGHPAYNRDSLSTDLHRFAFLLGFSDGEELFGEAAP